MDALGCFTAYRPTAPARARGCLTRTNYAEHLLCERDGRRHVPGVPAMRCAFWQPEPG